jgi:hypothetical protein
MTLSDKSIGGFEPELFGLFFLFFFLGAGILVVRVFLFVVIFLVFFFGDADDVDGMGLSNLQLGVALRAAQDFALLDFVFVQIYFCVAFRTFDHGGFSPSRDVPQSQGVLYTAGVTLLMLGV